MEKPILFEENNGIAVITLNRPERRNAINQEMLINLYNYLEMISKSTYIRVGILTGNGKSFCSGLDLSCIETEDLFDPRGDGNDLPVIMSNCRKPIFGAINGHAITGGFELALNCDFLIASENASFADTHARVGIQPGWGMSQLLPHAVGKRMAKQMSLTCNFITAQQSLQSGLVNEVVPHERLMHRAYEIAEDIISVKEDMVYTLKDLIDRGSSVTLSEGLALERKEFFNKLKLYRKNGKFGTNK